MPRGELKIGDSEQEALQVLNEKYAESGKTHHQIANEIGVSRTTVLKSLAGERATTYSEFVGISCALGLEPWKVMREAEARLENADHVPETYDPANEWELAAAGEYEQDPDKEAVLMMQEP